MSDYKEVLFLALFIAIFIAVYLVVNRGFSDAWAMMRVERTPNQFNDDESAIDKVIPLVEEAEVSLEIYDDGDDFTGSMYNNDAFVQSVIQKLDKNKEFVVECLFNENEEDLLFTKELVNHPRVSIYVRQKGGRNQIHYKIIDGGVRAYLSVHAERSRERAFKEVNCSKVPASKRDSVMRTLFEDIRQDVANFEKKEL